MMHADLIRIQWQGFCTLATKEITRILRIWKMTIAPPLLTTYLFCLVFGTVLGKRIGLIYGVDYLSFIIPGLLMNVVVLESFNNTASTLMIHKFHHVTDTLITSPMHELVLILAYIVGSLVRVILVSFFLIWMTLSISSLRIVEPLLLFYALCVTCCLFSLFGMISGLYANRFDELSTIPTFVLTPLSFFSGVFYDVSRLPEPWLSVSAYNPLVYLLQFFRRAFIEGYHPPIAYNASVMGLLTLAMLLLVLMLFKRGYGLKL